MSFPLSLLLFVASPNPAQARRFAGLARRLTGRHKLAAIVWGNTPGAELLAAELEQMRVPFLLRQMPGRWHWLRRRALRAELRTFLQEMSPQLLHLHASAGDLSVLRILCESGIPALYEPSSLFSSAGAEPDRATLRRERGVASLCRGVILSTDWQQEWVLSRKPRLVDSSRVVVVPPGLDPDLFSAAPGETSFAESTTAAQNRESQHLAGGVAVEVDGGRLNLAAEAQKRLDRSRGPWRVRLGAGEEERVVATALEPGDLPGLTFFFQMASRLFYLSKSIRFAVSGFSELPAHLNRGCPDDLSARFYWAGETSSAADLADFYRGVDVLVGCEKGLGVPYSLLEGQACGAAGAMLDSPGAEAVIRHNENGVTVAGSWMELARTVDDLLRDPERLERISAWGRVGAEQHFSLRATIPQLERLYRCATKCAPGGGLADLYYRP